MNLHARPQSHSTLALKKEEPSRARRAPFSKTDVVILRRLHAPVHASSGLGLGLGLGLRLRLGLG